MPDKQVTPKSSLTQARLKELLHYDPETGIFTWLVDRSGPSKAGTRAGYIENGYVRITIDSIWYAAHRLAVLYMTGRFPHHSIDHDNRVRSDNRWVNLIPATHADNAQNIPVLKNNTSGHTGVSWHKGHKKWEAHIRVSRKRYSAGYFANIEDAIAARAVLKRTHHTFHPIDNAAA